MNDDLVIQPGLVIPRRETWYEFSHASGPGGQNVNKVATAATLCFHPASSGVLTPVQKERVARRLANRINVDGVLRITAADARTQSANRSSADARFCELIHDALKVQKKRRPTRPSRGSIERRLVDKRFRAARKAGRGRTPGDVDDE
ncbi:MAG: aminoacyl-tRNA hydrolase [Planctomycetaceae bacterium]|nr:aminoacyl-tRNA hydrolase [Planctomycetaceae bacterium]